MKKITFLRNLLVLFTLLIGSASVMGQTEQLIYSTGFESSEGFTATTTYNNTTIRYDGPSESRWGSYYGTASTTGPISGSMSMQMRWYTAAPSNLGYIFTDFDIANATKVTFKALNTSGNNVSVSYSTDGGASYVGAQTFTLGTSASEFTYNISETGEYPSVRIRFQLVPGTTNGSRVTIDDVSVYGMVGGGSPTVATPTFTPTSALYFAPVSVSLGTTTDGASIYYTTNGDDPTEASTLYVDPFTVSSTTVVKARAYKDEMNASAIATATYSFPTAVSDIATLRSQATGATVYTLTGEAVLTLQTVTRNTKFIQDATAAISIDDPAGIITTSYSVGDGITGITGTLGVFRGMLQFTPVTDPGAATSTGNVVMPLAVTMEQLADNQARVITVSSVLISDVASGDGTFVQGRNYPMNSSDLYLLRTAYSDLPWLGMAIPATQQDVTGVVVVYDDLKQLVPRTSADFVNTPVATPLITVREISVPQMEALVDESTTETISVSGYNLTEAITLAVTGDDAAMFSLSTYSIAAVEGSVNDVSVTITYAPTAAGTHAATITLSSDGATNVTRTLSGVATEPAGPIVVPNVIITEVYGGGGNSGATLRNDFVELYNTTAEPVDIGGWSLQYYSATGTGTATSGNVFVFPAETFIQPNSHFLIQGAAGTGGSEDLPQPDAVMTINLGGTGGKIILYTVSEAQTIAASDLSSIIGNVAFKDYVPYGTTAVPVWGSPTTAVTNSTSAQRRIVDLQYVYTQNIGVDFIVDTPTPQNSGFTSSTTEVSILPVIVQGSQLRFEAVAGQRVEVYSAVGQRLYSNITNDGWNTVSLNARGILIVRVGDQVTKVIM